MKKTIKEPSIWLLIFLVGFPQISETIYTPSLPELSITLKATANQLQQTLSIYFIGFAIGVLLWGILSDRIGRRPSMLWGILVYIIGSIGCLYSHNVELLLAARVIQAIGAAAGSVVTQTVMRDIYDDSRRPQMFAKVSAVLAFSPAVGPLIGSVVAQYFGVSYVFVSLILIGIVAITMSYIGLYETQDSSMTSKSKVSILSVGKRMITDKYIWIYGSAIGIINGIIFSYYGEAPFIFIEHLNFSVVQYGCIGFVVALASLIGAMIGKKLIRKMHYTLVMQIGFSTILVASLLFGIIAYLSPGLTIEMIGFIGSIFFIMAGIGIALPSCLSNALISYRDCLGISGALLGLFYYIQVGIFTGIMSLIHNAATITFPIYIFILTLILIGMTIILKKETRNNE